MALKSSLDCHIPQHNQKDSQSQVRWRPWLSFGLMVFLYPGYMHTPQMLQTLLARSISSWKSYRDDRLVTSGLSCLIVNGLRCSCSLYSLKQSFMRFSSLPVEAYTTRAIYHQTHQVSPFQILISALALVQLLNGGSQSVPLSVSIAVLVSASWASLSQC